MFIESNYLKYFLLVYNRVGIVIVIVIVVYVDQYTVQKRKLRNSKSNLFNEYLSVKLYKFFLNISLLNLVSLYKLTKVLKLFGNFTNTFYIIIEIYNFRIAK